MTRLAIAIFTATVLMLNACSDKPEAKAGSPNFGDVAFTAYEEGGFRVVFASDSTVVKTWRNMNGAAVNGTWAR